MHHHQLLILFALLIFAFGLVSRFAERNWITGPMVFMTVGILGSSLAFGFLHVTPDMGPVKLVAELALTLVLFIDATMINRDAFTSGSNRIPVRLLLIGLPLTMIFGTVFGVWMFDGVSIWAIMLMAFILSPTDAALGQAVVKSEGVPIQIRQSISVESGLNDGIALPPILIVMALLGAEAGEHEGAWLGFVIKQVTLGPVVGLAVGFIGGKLMQIMSDKGWTEETFQRLSALPLAILAFAFAESVEGNGFIAAFVAGLGLTAAITSQSVKHQVQEFGETEGMQLILVVFLIFGLAMVPAAVPYWGTREVVYALASLTVLRMLPVAISLIGAKLDWQTITFIGWFGPRGIASVLYLLMAVAAIGQVGFERVMSVIVLTIMISVYAHGVSAMPLSLRYGASRPSRDM
ncbi:MAG: cation:proton antiporter [Gammaproteobacteria bacterium]|nr:cation:proton antiporter [Gammaproteobacteria bacterium]MDH3751106.1 cation:proton antiporter [Gammaproteobacteria bacterium]MDH3805056.1 cation:proton antiporter [Gammaproteobacteria bacterium]